MLLQFVCVVTKRLRARKICLPVLHLPKMEIVHTFRIIIVNILTLLASVGI